MLFYFPHYQHQKGTHPGVAIIQGDYKLIKFYEEGTNLLFNLKEDISETKNLASTYPKKVIELEKHINNYFLKYNIKKPSVNNEYKAEEDEGLNYKEVKKKLMSEAYFIP
jgi:arylsulfatase A-like enzyme